jgi:hypothetical protein
MTKKALFILGIFAIIFITLLSLSFVSAYYSNNYAYAGSGVVVYPTYVLRQVCQPFMPCGVQKINIANNYQAQYNNQNNYNNRNENENIPEESREGDLLFDELSSPGINLAVADHNSPTYNPLFRNRNNNYQNNQNTYYVVDYGSYNYQENNYWKNPAPSTRVVVVYV